MDRQHLLLAITADVDGLALVESAHAWAQALHGTWSVVAVDTPGLEDRGKARRAALWRALDRAQQLGATVSRISTGTNTMSAVVSALVHRVQSESATTLLLGRPRREAPLSRAATGLGLGDWAEAIGRLLPGTTIHLVCPPGAAPARGADASAQVALRFPMRGWAQVIATLVAATVSGFAVERALSPDDVVMLYLAGVVYVASRVGRLQAVATVLGGVLLYNLVFVAPRWSLKPTEPRYWLAFVVILVVGLVISQLAARSREQALLAEARAQRSQALNELSLALGRARDPRAVAQALRRTVQAALGTAVEVLLLGPQGEVLGPEAPWQGLYRVELARQALQQGFETGHATPTDTDAPLRYVPLVVGERPFGLLLHAPPPSGDALEDQHLVRACANQAAIALERADLERRSLAAAVEAEGERTRNTLLAGISHDFRTPLTTIMGSATLLLEQSGAIDEERRMALLQTLLNEARRLHLLSSNLLDLTRLDEGGIKLRPEWCPADELLDSAERQLASQLQGLQLSTSVPADLLVWCDVRLIDQVLVNLLENAIRHSPEGGTIRVAIAAADRHWSLTVHDDGPGIPPGEEQAILRRFYRATGTADSMGTGLGLALCEAIAALHAGTITAHNDGGAKFILTLPLPLPPRLDPDEPDDPP